ncbi:MAG TPA: hypothetical protein PKH09_08980, partial [Parvularculaceae bacterium]|nr:hypothetical protein [Parvularculaceae bacterium]
MILSTHKSDGDHQPQLILVIDARFGGVSGGDLDVRETLRVALLIAPLMHNGAATSAPRPEVSGAMG